MSCFFPETHNGPSAAQRLSEITGLPAALLAAGDEILRDEHLADLTADQQAKLVQHLGNPVCGLARALGLTDLDAGDYQPSAPFISLQAASLAIGRVLAYKFNLDGQPNLVQYDGLYGPQTATLDTMQPLADCYCQTHSTTIKKVRTLRAGYRTTSPGTHPPTDQPSIRTSCPTAPRQGRSSPLDTPVHGPLAPIEPNGDPHTLAKSALWQTQR